MRIRLLGAVALIGLPLLAGCSPDSAVPGQGELAPPADPARRVEWPVHGGDQGAQRYSPLEEITPNNVGSLQLAWEWRTGERELFDDEGTRIRPGSFEATPIMLADTLYLSTPYHHAVALDAASGRELWRFDPGTTKVGAAGFGHPSFVHRGVAVWSGPSERRVFLNSREHLLALDAATGLPISSFGREGRVDLTRDLRWPVNPSHYGQSSPPVVWRDLVVVGSAIPDRLIQDRPPTGEVQAFDVRTGRRIWQWNPIPRPGEPGGETWDPDASDRIGHTNVWAPFSVDTARGLLYLPVSTPTNDWYGGRRRGAGLYGESLVCLDARTGRMVWHYQIVHHGLWDYDPPSAPMLISLAFGGRQVEAVALPGKTGFLYAFDRLTGTPLWPIEERPVPGSDVPGEEAHPTQPVPTRPPPFARQGISDSDLVDFTPELRARARESIRGYRTGPMFTPPSLRGTIVMPGWWGGAGWGGGAFDPASGVVYVKASNRPVLARLVPRDGAGYELDLSQDAADVLDLTLRTRRGLFRLFGDDVPIPLVRPPYGTLSAIDLALGTIRWQVPVGDMPEVRFHPLLKSLDLPPLGVAGAPGPLVTRSGLLFLTGGGDVLYAIDARDGAVRWSAPLGQIGWANPMTYRTAGGRQMVLIATGRGEGARLMAFALPAGQP
jgi:quinoprotein glucose dehydrogenase